MKKEISYRNASAFKNKKFVIFIGLFPSHGNIEGNVQIGFITAGVEFLISKQINKST